MLTALVVWIGVSLVLAVPVARLLHRSHQTDPDAFVELRRAGNDHATSAGQEAWEHLPYRQAG